MSDLSMESQIMYQKSTNLYCFSVLTACLTLLLSLACSCEVLAFSCFGKTDSASCSDNGSCTKTNICSCSAGWSGPECETPTFCGELTCALSCSSQGVCTETGSNGSCKCSPGFTGSCCATPILSRTYPPVDFGSVRVAVPSKAHSVTFNNPYMSTMTIGAIDINGSGRSDFILGKGCASGDAVAVGESCNLVVIFAPQAPGLRSATLSVAAVNVATTTALTTSLSGRGTVSSDNIVIDPQMSAIRYALLDGTGIYLSTDSGHNWVAAAVQPANRHIKALVIVPGDNQRLYAATFGGGVYTSGNRGTDWIACATQPSSLELLSLTIDAGGRLYAESDDSVFVSSGGCGIWTTRGSGFLAE